MTVDSDEEDEEDDEGVQEEQHEVDPLRMGSIGCTDDERWKRYSCSCLITDIWFSHPRLMSILCFLHCRLLWSSMPRPEESDSDEEGDLENGEDGEANHGFSADVEATGAREVM